jgi:cytosine/adenosine deaminase-related metal-dependent hydrolase
VTFVNAQVMGEDGVIADSLRVERGRVAALSASPRREDLAVDLDGARILPGLINAHDHLELNNFGRLKWRDCYPNVADWIADFRPRFAADPALTGPLTVPLHDRLWLGGLKNLLSGVTTVGHHNPFYRPLRRGSPLRVVRRYGFSHSLGLDGERVAMVYRRTPADWPWIIHAAEGTDTAAAAELARLDGLGCLGPNTVLVHGVGLSACDRGRLRERGAALIWCPASNNFLFGQTAPVAELAAAGRVALGTDSRLSGARDLLEELQVAGRTGQVDAHALWWMVTTDAARILRLPEAGSLRIGAPADLAVIPPGRTDGFRWVLELGRAQLRLVMIGGRPRFADPDLQAVFAAAGIPAGRFCLDGREKVMDVALLKRLMRLPAWEPGIERLSEETAPARC